MGQIKRTEEAAEVATLARRTLTRRPLPHLGSAVSHSAAPQCIAQLWPLAQHKHSPKGSPKLIPCPLNFSPIFSHTLLLVHWLARPKLPKSTPLKIAHERAGSGARAPPRTRLTVGSFFVGQHSSPELQKGDPVQDPARWMQLLLGRPQFCSAAGACLVLLRRTQSQVQCA